MTEDQLQFAELQDQLVKMADENKKLAQALKLQEVEKKIAAFSEQGKILPAQYEVLTQLFLIFTEDQEELFNNFISHSPDVLGFLEVEYSEFNKGEYDHLLTPSEMAHKYLD